MTTERTVIPFMRFAKPASLLSLCLVMLALYSLATKGLNWGLDFTGGTLIEIELSQPLELAPLRDHLQQAEHNATVQYFGSSKDVLIRLAPSAEQNPEQQGAVVQATLQQLDAQLRVKRVEFVGPAVGKELAEQGVLAIIASLLCILAYLAMRFEWRLSAGAVLALGHDVIITLGIFSALAYEFDLTVLAAVMTVVGYSLNDTIVVFDRFRENMRKLRKGDTAEVLNISMTETLTRTLITSATTLVVVVALFVKGGSLLHGFATALLIGIGFGTYSSIYVASACALLLGVQREHMIPTVVLREGEDHDSLG